MEGGRGSGYPTSEKDGKINMFSPAVQTFSSLPADCLTGYPSVNAKCEG
jgi:hypothetical protein